MPCSALACPGRANPAKVQLSLPSPASSTRLDSTRLDWTGAWTDLTDGQTGSHPDWFILQCQPNRGPTLAHQSLPAGHGDGDWDGDWDWGWGGGLGGGREGGICKFFLRFPASLALCCTSPPRQGW